MGPNESIKMTFHVLIHNASCCRIYAELYKFFFHPFTTISYSGSVFMTVGITIER